MTRTVFRNGALLDTGSGELRPGSSVRVEADRIVEEAHGGRTYTVLQEGGQALGPPEVSQRKGDDVLEAGRGAREICKQAGVKIGFGTGLLGETHEPLSREFTIRAQVLSPAEMLRSVTVVNAEILNRRGELGVMRLELSGVSGP